MRAGALEATPDCMGGLRSSAVERIGLVLAAAFIIGNLSPFLTHWGHALQRAWITYALWVAAVFLGPKVHRASLWMAAGRRRTELIVLFGWVMILGVNLILRRGFTADLHLLHGLNMCLMISIGLYYSPQPGRLRQLVLIALAGLSIDVLRSLPTLWTQPGIARLSMQVFEVREETKQEAILAGVGQYGFYTALAITLPAMIGYSFTGRRFTKWGFVALTAIFLAAIVISTFMGAALLAAIGGAALCCLHILVTANRAKVLLGYGGALLGLVVVWGVVLTGAEQISYVTDKLQAQIANIRRFGLDGDQTARLELWQMSLSTFGHHPLFGIGPVTGRENTILHRDVGGHASWLDQLAEYGIVGAGVYWLWLALVFRRLLAELRYSREGRAMRAARLGQLITFALFIIAGSYNPVIFILEIYSLFALLGTNSVTCADADRFGSRRVGLREHQRRRLLNGIAARQV